MRSMIMILAGLVCVGLSGCQQATPTPIPTGITMDEWQNMATHEAVHFAVCGVMLYLDEQDIGINELTPEVANEAGRWGSQNARACYELRNLDNAQSDDFAGAALVGCIDGLALAQRKDMDTTERIQLDADLKALGEANQLPSSLEPIVLACTSIEPMLSSMGEGIANSR